MDLFTPWNISVVLISVISAIWVYFQWSYTYWKKKNLPFLKPSFPFGTMENPFARTASLGVWLKKNYDQLKSQGHNHAGIYNFSLPAYLPISPDYVKNIMQTDFNHFVDRGYYYNEKDDPLSAHLFAIGGKRWRNLHTKLTPAFTAAKLKLMFETLFQCSIPLKNKVDQAHQNQEPIDIKELAACFTTDVVGSFAFGLECNSFEKDAEIRNFGRKIFQRTKFQTAIGLLVYISYPELGRFLRLKFLPKETTQFIMNLVKNTINYRETNNLVRNDILQVLIDLKNNMDKNGNNDEEGKSLTLQELTAQVFGLFANGFETSAVVLTYCLFELSINPEIQQKVRNEVNDALKNYGGKVTFDALSEMNYMAQVVDETLRKYPPIPFLTRKCVKDYEVPGTDVVIDKNTLVFIPVLGIHHDPEYYPEPEVFNPQRFSKEDREQRYPFTYIGFGGGPRACIAHRLGMLQIKLALTVLLKTYEFSLNNKTKTPLEVDPYRNFFATKGTIWLNTKKI